jgi:glycosyltransferase involved in cell wall biosynthesis
VSQAENPEMAAVLSNSDGRLRKLTYTHLAERISIGAKRNLAVQQATGEIVVHWDDDDYFREHRISAQVAPIIRGEVDMTVLEHHYYYILPTQSFYVVKRAASWGPHFGTFVFRKVLPAVHTGPCHVCSYSLNSRFFGRHTEPVQQRHPLPR